MTTYTYKTCCEACGHEYRHNSVKAIFCQGCKAILRYDCGLTALHFRAVVVELLYKREGKTVALPLLLARQYAKASHAPDVLVQVDDVIDDLARMRIVLRNGTWVLDKRLPCGYPNAKLPRLG